MKERTDEEKATLACRILRLPRGSMKILALLAMLKEKRLTRKDISKYCGISIHSAYRSLKRLCELEMVRRTTNYDAEKMTIVNEYQIRTQGVNETERKIHGEVKDLEKFFFESIKKEMEEIVNESQVNAPA